MPTTAMSTTTHRPLNTHGYPLGRRPIATAPMPPAPTMAFRNPANPAPYFPPPPLPTLMGSMSSVPYTAPTMSPVDPFSNRSFTPLPVPLAPPMVPSLERPSMVGGREDKLSQSLTMLPPGFVAPSPSELDSTRAAAMAADAAAGGGLPAPGSQPMLTGEPEVGNNIHPSSITPSRLSHRPRSPSFSQAPVTVRVNVYWQRPVEFDEHGRAQRRLGGGELSWGKKFLKDVLGVYHVGIEVHDQEYTFGNYRAPGARQIGGASSGVYAHEPRQPGPHCVFKQYERLGSTTSTPGQVEDICTALGRGEFAKASYNKIHHNCVDFAQTLSARLGAGEIPGWCYRGAAIGKILGIGEQPPGQEEANENIAPRSSNLRPPSGHNMDGSISAPVVERAIPRPDHSAGGGPSYVAPPPPPPTLPNTGTYVAPAPPPPAPVAGPPTGRLPTGRPGRGGSQSYVAPPMPTVAMPPTSHAGTYVAPPSSMARLAGRGPSFVPEPSLPIVAAAPVEAEVFPGRYPVRYEPDWSSEANKAVQRIMPLPDGSYSMGGFQQRQTLTAPQMAAPFRFAAPAAPAATAVSPYSSVMPHSYAVHPAPTTVAASPASYVGMRGRDLGSTWRY